MKFIACFVLVALSACSSPNTFRSYTITETSVECTSNKCEKVTKIIPDRDCTSWDPSISLGMEMCDSVVKSESKYAPAY